MYASGGTYIHTSVWGWYEVCMLAEEHTYIRPFGAGVRYVC